MLAPFNFGHLDDVYIIEKQSFLSPWSKKQLLSYCDNQFRFKSFVFFKQKTIIGYIMSQVILEEIHLHNFAVCLQFRRKGVGSRMLLDFIHILKLDSIKKICLEVKDSNISAIKFYISHKFNPVGERKNYYEDGSNAILMDKVF